MAESSTDILENWPDGDLSGSGLASFACANDTFNRIVAMLRFLFPIIIVWLTLSTKEVNISRNLSSICRPCRTIILCGYDVQVYKRFGSSVVPVCISTLLDTN